MVLKSKLLRQIICFGIVGVIAACVHFGVVISLVEWRDWQPLMANVIAFLIAFQVSYWGHRYWTFQATHVHHRSALPKLFLVCSMGFVANESLYFMLLTLFHLPYALALFIVLAFLPLLTFILGKLWVFR